MLVYLEKNLIVLSREHSEILRWLTVIMSIKDQYKRGHIQAQFKQLSQMLPHGLTPYGCYAII